MSTSTLLLVIHSGVVWYLLLLLLIFDTAIYFKILKVKKHEWYQFIVSLYVPSYHSWKFFVVLEIIFLFVLSFLFSGMLLYILSKFFGKMLPIVLVSGFIGSAISAFLTPIQEIVGVTRPSVKNIGFPYMGNLIEWIIFLWKEDSTIGKSYTRLLVSIRYTLWSLPISFIVLPVIIKIFFR